MNRKSVVLGALLVGLTGLGVVLFAAQGHGEKGKTTAKTPAQNEAKPESKDAPMDSAKHDSTLEWAEAHGKGDPKAKTLVPPNIQAVLSGYGLDKKLWDRYREQSADQLTGRLKELKGQFDSLKSNTDSLRDRHSQLAREGHEEDAKELLDEEMMPLMNKRDQLLGEAILVVNAKAMVTGLIDEVPSEMRTN